MLSLLYLHIGVSTHWSAGECQSRSQSSPLPLWATGGTWGVTADVTLPPANRATVNQHCLLTTIITQREMFAGDSLLIITELRIFSGQPVSLSWHTIGTKLIILLRGLLESARVCSLFLVTVGLCVAIPKNLTKSRSENTKKYKISETHQRFYQLMSCYCYDLIPGNTIIMNDWVDCWWVDVVLIPPGVPLVNVKFNCDHITIC